MEIIEDVEQFFRGRREPDLHLATDVGSGPPVILIHGIASSSATFVFLVPMIQHNHRVVAIDLLGFGESPKPQDADYTLEEHVAAVDEKIRSLKLREPFTLVGHSLGTLISSRYASTHHRQVNRLVLVSPPVYLTPKEISDPRQRIRVSGYLKAFEYLRTNKDFTLARAATVSRLLPVKHVLEITEETWIPFVKSLQNCLETETILADLAKVQAPVDVAYGSLDEFIAPGSLEIIARMRHVTMHVVRASDHMIRKPLARVVAAAVNARDTGDTTESAVRRGHQ
jgi:pimeloyl-ACP methyl ester carboxylesterase